ncbi:MAG: hypothetical protein MUF87_08070 [Anaerolineae bacterium]|nr:hypothetical protein [Anaerolineae bacterium]
MTESRRSSRYERPRYPISFTALILGVVIGIAGGLFYAWNLAPTEEFNTEPWQLRADDQAHYVVAIMLNYAYDSDLALAVTRLAQLRPPVDPIQYVADVACDLARSGYVNDNSGLTAIRAMMRFYQGQGRTGCADQLIPAAEGPIATEALIIAATPTLPPPPTKTATPSGSPQLTPTTEIRAPSTPAPQSAFQSINPTTFCDPEFAGVIEIYVRDGRGQPVPGQPIRVVWADGESLFFTGLQPLRGLDYADFQMTPNTGYTVEMPGLSEPTNQLIASTCVSADGTETITSYRVIFIPR